MRALFLRTWSVVLGILFFVDSLIRQYSYKVKTRVTIIKRHGNN